MQHVRCKGHRRQPAFLDQIEKSRQHIEDDSAADPADWIREVLYVNSVADTDLTLELDGRTDDTIAGRESVGRGQDFTDNSRVYSLGCQLLIREFSITDWEPVGGATDTIYQRVPFKAGGWTGTHPDEGASFEHPALGYLVR